MKDTNYLIIGNSAAALSAIEAIRKIDRQSGLTLVSAEKKNAYSRVATPYYLAREIPEKSLFLKEGDYYKGREARTIFGKKAVTVAAENKNVTLEDGSELHYEKLLIASGSTPRVPSVKGLEEVKPHTHWTLEDAKKIAAASDKAKKVLMLGGGFIGLLTANALKKRNSQLKLTILEIMPHLMPNLLDDYAASLLEERMKSQGLEVYTGAEAVGVEKSKARKISVSLKNGGEIRADLIIVGAGVAPNVGFLEGSGIEVGRGIIVNDRMETSAEGVYAAGDCAETTDLLTGHRVVHAIWPTAVEQGTVAGSNMAGASVRYPGSLSMNVVDLFGLTFASMGIFREDKGLEVLVFKDKNKPTYRKILLEGGKRIVGFLAVGGDLEPRYMGAVQSAIRRGMDLSLWKADLPLNLNLLARSFLELQGGKRLEFKAVPAF